MAQEDASQRQSTLQLPERAPPPSPAPAEMPVPHESTQDSRPSSPTRRDGTNRTDWIGWLIVLLAFLLVNCLLGIYCYWIFLPYPRW